MAGMGDHGAGAGDAGRSLLDDWREALAAIERALRAEGGNARAEVYVAERAALRLRDALSRRLAREPASAESGGLRSALSQIDTAIGLISGVSYPAAGRQHQALEQARDILLQLGAGEIRGLEAQSYGAEFAAPAASQRDAAALGGTPPARPVESVMPDPARTDVYTPSARTSQVFHRATNTVARVSLFGGLLLLVALTLSGARLNTSAFKTNQYASVAQPVPFSHQHHVAGLGLDCRYCHTSVENSAFAGIPPTETCMTCHSQIWNQAPMLQPVRDSFATGQPIEWNRVHDLPDFVYFNHSIHIAKGIGCTSCHGQVNEMPLMRKVAPLNMAWCLGCHREPEKYIRPVDQVFSMDWTPPANQVAMGRDLLKKYHVDTTRLTNCSLCHH